MGRRAGRPSRGPLGVLKGKSEETSYHYLVPARLFCLNLSKSYCHSDLSTVRLSHRRTMTSIRIDSVVKCLEMYKMEI